MASPSAGACVRCSRAVEYDPQKASSILSESSSSFCVYPPKLAASLAEFRASLADDVPEHRGRGARTSSSLKRASGVSREVLPLTTQVKYSVCCLACREALFKRLSARETSEPSAVDSAAGGAPRSSAERSSSSGSGSSVSIDDPSKVFKTDPPPTTPSVVPPSTPRLLEALGHTKRALLSLLEERARLDRESLELTREETALSRDVRSTAEATRACAARVTTSKTQLELLKVETALALAFFTGPFTKNNLVECYGVNGLRLGKYTRLEETDSATWSEINAGWGEVALMVSRLAGLSSKVETAGVHILPMGGRSRVRQGGKVYPLYYEEEETEEEEEGFTQGLFRLSRVVHGLCRVAQTGMPESEFHPIHFVLLGPRASLSSSSGNGAATTTLEDSRAISDVLVSGRSLRFPRRAYEEETSARVRWNAACCALLENLERVRKFAVTHRFMDEPMVGFA